MSQASVRLAEPGVLSLAGTLDYSTGAALRQEGKALIASAGAAPLILDCSAVEHSSSVGVSLLLCFLRDAQAAGKPMAIRGMPADMQQIAQVNGVSVLLAQP